MNRCFYDSLKLFTQRKIFFSGFNQIRFDFLLYLLIGLICIRDIAMERRNKSKLLSELYCDQKMWSFFKSNRFGFSASKKQKCGIS